MHKPTCIFWANLKPFSLQSLQSLAQGLPSSITDGAALDAYIVAMLDGTGYSAESATWSGCD
jgi:hypothetical protein